MEIKIPAPAEEILTKLNDNGYEAYVVGGCVRDMILGREPGDWDITTSALPEQVKQVFRRTVDTGIQHGTVTVMMGDEGYEVTTYRIDGEYADGRHPDSVTFTPSLTEDLKRRDFTINAMAYNGNTGLVDEFGGMDDLDRGIIRCVGEPMDRFSEDALRILRAIRFSAQLGFTIEGCTYEAIRAIAPNMVHVSKERIQVELTKLLLSPNPGHINMVYETGISPYVSETFHKVYCREEDGGLDEGKQVERDDGPRPECADRQRPEGENGRQVEREDGKPFFVIPAIPAQVPPVRHMRWAAFLRKCPPDEAVRILKDLKLDNDTINRVRTLVSWQDYRLGPDKYSIRTAMSRMEPDLFDDLLDFRMCLAQIESEGNKTCQEHLAHTAMLVDEIRRDGDCISLKTLAVGGNDIIKAGVKPGKEVGLALARLLEMVLEEPGRNTKEYLLQHLV